LASSLSDLKFDFGEGILLPPSCAMGKKFSLGAAQLPLAVWSRGSTFFSSLDRFGFIFTSREPGF
jgi:hypothetical protein